MAAERSDEKLKEELFKQIGQLRVENEWLKKYTQFFGQNVLIKLW